MTAASARASIAAATSRAEIADLTLSAEFQNLSASLPAVERDGLRDLAKERCAELGWQRPARRAA